jgi:hypothetical protein
MLGEGMSESEILKAYPDLELDDIRESLRFESAVHRRVQRAIREVDEGKYTAYEGRDGLRKLADKVKSRGRHRLAATKSREPL